MADRYWVGGSGTWSSTNTANWSTSSGGPSGASVPTSADNVIFDAGSDAGANFTVTMANSPRVCNDFTASGLGFTMTLAGTSIGLTVSGSLEFPATNFTRTYTGTTTFNATTTGKTVTTNGVIFGGLVTFDGVGGEWTLGSAITLSGTLQLALNNGTFDTSTSNYSVTCGRFNSSNSNIRTINLNGSTVSCSVTTTSSTSGSWNTNTSTNATLNAGTSTILLTSAGGVFTGGGLTFHNLEFNSAISTTSIKRIVGSNTFNDVTFATISSSGLNTVYIYADQTINGTLTVNGSNGNRRMFVRSFPVGTGRTLTCASIAAMTDVDFREITIAGAASPLSGTRLGDCGNNTNITFGAGVNKYWNLAGGGSWSSTAWATSSGGTPADTNFPLTQDTVIIENTGLNTSATVTIDLSYNIGIFDMSTRSNAMTLSSSSTADPCFYDNLIYNSAITHSGTCDINFYNNSIKTFDPSGNTFNNHIYIEAPNGGIQLINNNFVNSSARITYLNRGTLDLNDLDWTTGRIDLANSNPRTLDFGTGQINCTGTATVWNGGTVTNLTISGTPVVNVTSTGSTAITVYPGPLPEADAISFNFTGGTYNLTFLGSLDHAVKNVDFTGYAGTWQANASTAIVYGNFTMSTGMSSVASSNQIRFSATSGTQAITTNGQILDRPVWVTSGGSTFQLQDAMTLASTRTLSLYGSTPLSTDIDLNGFTLTCGSFYIGNLTKNITFNGGTIVVTDSGSAAWNNSGSGTFTTTAGTGTGAISMTSASAKTFVGNSKTYNCNLNQGGSGDLTITGSNTFNDITNSVQPATILFTAGTTQTVSDFTLSGTAGNLITIDSTTASQFTLSKASGTVSVSYLDIADSNATGGATWTALTSNGNVDSGNNTGWTFSSGTIYNVSVSETGTSADTITLVLVRVGSVSETATGTDTTAGTLTRVGSVSETATGADTTAAGLSFTAYIDENLAPYSVVQNTSALPIGTSFTGSTIFNNASAGGGLTVAANGTGSGSNGGFDAGGNYVLFTGNNTRYIQTIALDLVLCADFSFSIIRGNSSNGGETPDLNENIVIEYSTNGGSSYTTIDTILNTAAITSFTTLSYSMPVGARTASTIIRWRQTSSSQSGFDQYGIRTFTFNFPGGAADTTASQLDAVGAVSETATGADADSATLTRVGAVSETGTGADTSAGTLTRVGSVSETATGTETTASQLDAVGAVSETATGTDTTAGTLTRVGAVSETTTGADTTASQLDAVGSVSETATGTDTIASQLDGVGSVSETTTGADTTASQLDAVGSVSETATGTDADSATLTRVGAVSETATGTDTIASQLDAVGAVSETATGTDTIASQLDAVGAVSETGTGADVDSATLTRVGSVSETATGTDTIASQLDGVGAVSETATGADTTAGTLIITLQISEGATISDASLARLLWELINDNQLPGWQIVASDQGSGWTIVNTQAGGSWTDIGTL